MALVRLFPKLIGLIFIMGLVGGTSHAQSGWTLCNETSFIIEAATARENNRAMVVEGWTRLRPGECRVAVPAPLTPGAHFLFARSSSAHRGGVREWAGGFDLCVDVTGSFSLESPPDCVAMGLEPRGFQPIMIESRSRWRNKFTETENYTLERAEAAGIQRLLTDAGVETTKIDGYIGRSTRRAMQEFLRINELPTDSDEADLIDLLEQGAIERARNVGLTLCNRSDKRVWAAIARRRGEGWESRGWWALEARGCERVIDEPLINTEHYVYAELEDEDGLRTLTGANETFCISRSKFAIRGREDCDVELYAEGLFIQTRETEAERIVHEFFERDFITDAQPGDAPSSE